MDALSPLGKMLMSGTGHLVAVLGAVAALEEIRALGFYAHIHALAARLHGGLNDIFEGQKIKAVCEGLGGRFGIYFGRESGGLAAHTLGNIDETLDRLDDVFATL